MLVLRELMVRSLRTTSGRNIMKRKKVTMPRLFTVVLLFAGIASCASTANKGVVIAMGGGNGTPEIYEKWKSLGGGKNAHVVLITTANNPGDDIAPVVNGLKQLAIPQYFGRSRGVFMRPPVSMRLSRSLAKFIRGR